MNVHESFSHEQAVELLPWLVNDSLDEEEREALLEHASACVICPRELKDLEQIRTSVSQVALSTPVPEPDMRNINARIDGFIDKQNRGRELLSRLGNLFESRWRIAFAAQTLVLLVLVSVLIWPKPDGAEFTTLTQPDNLPDGSYVRVVFSPDIQESRLAKLLASFGLTVVDGPTNRGVYTLSAGESAHIGEELVSSLQDDPDVLFAQPVVIGEGR